MTFLELRLYSINEENIKTALALESAENCLILSIELIWTTLSLFNISLTPSTTYIGLKSLILVGSF